MATTNDIKNGTVLKLEGQLWNIIEFQHVKPGKGGAFVRTKMRNVMSGKVVDKTFNAGLKIETATVDRRDYQYLYQDGADFVFMDTSDFDQLTVPGATVGDATNFMLENQMVNIAIHEGNPLYIELPAERRARNHLHRAGPAGRPLLGRHQARHPRDRLRDPGAAVRREQHQGQGRHPRRQLPRPGQRLVSARGKARNRALDVLFEAEQRSVSAFDVLKSRREQTDQIVNPYTLEIVNRRGFVGSDSCPQQIGNGDRRDHQNDRDHDQQLNQRESSAGVGHSAIWLGTAHSIHTGAFLAPDLEAGG